MRLNWMNGLRCLLALDLMSGLVACGSFANCFNSGFAPAACGGGYVESDLSSLPQPTATSAEGLWTGTTSTGRAVAGLVLDDGSYWLFYTASDNRNILAGLVQGTGTSHFGSFGSSNSRNFHVEGVGIRAATMSGSYVLTLVTGTYVGLRPDHHAVTVTVDSAGTLSGHSTDGCTVAGTLFPRGKGNLFHTSVTFGGGACRQGTETVTGVAFYDAATHRLYSAALNSARTTSFLFLGTKQ